jgi:hypothetical protein
MANQRSCTATGVSQDTRSRSANPPATFRRQVAEGVLGAHDPTTEPVE